MLEEIKKYVRSYVPGRLRLRHSALVGLDSETVKAITSTITSAEGITECTINPAVGSLLLLWDTKKITEETLAGYFAFWMALLPAGMEETVAEENQNVVDAKHTLAKELYKGNLLLEDAVTRGKSLSAFALDKLSAVLAPDQKKSARRRRVTQNRLMFLTCVASIGAIALGSKAHTALGLGFLSLLAVHLKQHKTVL